MQGRSREDGKTEDNNDTGIAFYTALARETGGAVLEIVRGIALAPLGRR